MGQTLAELTLAEALALLTQMEDSPSEYSEREKCEIVALVDLLSGERCSSDS